jgi:hypothetical protein
MQLIFIALEINGLEAYRGDIFTAQATFSGVSRRLHYSFTQRLRLQRVTADKRC